MCVLWWHQPSEEHFIEVPKSEKENPSCFYNYWYFPTAANLDTLTSIATTVSLDTLTSIVTLVSIVTTAGVATTTSVTTAGGVDTTAGIYTVNLSTINFPK